MTDFVSIDNGVCCRDGCTERGVVYAGGRCFCFSHAPVIFDESEARRLMRDKL